jgi:hypothetical protein
VRFTTGSVQVQNYLYSAYLIVMMLRMIRSPSHQGLDATRGYEREMPTKEVALFGALLLLPIALLLVLTLVAG